MNIELDIVQTIYDDATAQLGKYGKTLEEKLEDIVEDYALEYRRSIAKKDIIADIENRITKADIRGQRNLNIIEEEAK